jgi:hypothetical protein
MAMTQTILYDAREVEVAGAEANGDRLWLPVDELPAATGWAVKPEGLCRGEVCVPVSGAQRAAWLGGAVADRIDFAGFAQYLGHAVARDPDRGGWAFGPPADRGGAETGAGPVMAPEFQLPDLDGKLHSLSDYRGKKILLYAWASW